MSAAANPVLEYLEVVRTRELLLRQARRAEDSMYAAADWLRERRKRGPAAVAIAQIPRAQWPDAAEMSALLVHLETIDRRVREMWEALSPELAVGLCAP